MRVGIADVFELVRRRAARVLLVLVRVAEVYSYLRRPCRHSTLLTGAVGRENSVAAVAADIAALSSEEPFVQTRRGGKLRRAAVETQYIIESKHGTSQDAGTLAMETTCDARIVQ